MSFKGLLTNIAQSKIGDISKMAKDEKSGKLDLQGFDASNLAEVENILGGEMQQFDAKSDHEKIAKDAKMKAQKLFGDAKERKFAKKKEKQKMSNPSS